MDRMLKAVAAPAVLVALFSVPAQGGNPGDGVITAELLPGWQTETGTHMAGLRLKMAPGWKTYWRAPGDAGIPPRFDWRGSDNMRAARIYWPRPDVFDSNGMRTIGYHGQVVLPVELTPRDPDQPLGLALSVDLGVCQDICMPMTLDVSASLPGAGETAPIRAALAAQPETATQAKLGDVHCDIDPISDGLRLTAEIDVPSLGRGEAVVFELPDPSIWVSEADLRREGGRLIASSDLVPVTGTPFALDRSSVRITLLGSARAIDIRGCTGR
ncbi:DsbC/DsbD-like thiol-disulfide interchange protein [Rhodovulum iodosum]|uniref:DsbC/DsbD-like thiol-disulfide interchange protein n=2 Tax=Rhodovulum iodosum TaxID=68291 RepID=A0ABV3XR77_9RHOB